jgi:hypothetical protein
MNGMTDTSLQALVADRYHTDIASPIPSSPSVRHDTTYPGTHPPSPSTAGKIKEQTPNPFEFFIVTRDEWEQNLGSGTHPSISASQSETAAYAAKQHKSEEKDQHTVSECLLYLNSPF